MKFKAVQGKVLIKPNKEIKVTRTQLVHDEEKNKGKDPRTDIMDVKKIKKRVRANYQIGVVLASSENSIFSYGDTIAYKGNAVVEFDLIKNTLMIDEYAIVGWVDLNGEIEDEDSK